MDSYRRPHFCGKLCLQLLQLHSAGFAHAERHVVTVLQAVGEGSKHACLNAIKHEIERSFNSVAVSARIAKLDS